MNSMCYTVNNIYDQGEIGMEHNQQPELTEKQAEIIIKYVQERRSEFMAAMIVSAVVAVFMTPLAIFDICLIAGKWDTAGRGEPVVLLIWFAAAVTAAVMFMWGIGIQFGKGSDIDCVRRKHYTCSYTTCGRKTEDTKKHPYYVYDLQNHAYICPVFLEWRKAKKGCRPLCITLENGKAYAFPDNPVNKVDLEKRTKISRDLCR